jgi:hypothetical protein
VRRDIFSNLEESEGLRGRVLRYLAFRQPSASTVLARVGRASLQLLEAMKMRHRWQKLYGVLTWYWYLRGLADELGSEAALSAYVESVPALREAPDGDFDLDLAGGLEAAEQMLNAHRPESVHLRMGDFTIGRIEPLASAERLRGAHLRAMLATRFSWELLHAIARGRTSLAGVDPARGRVA